MKAGPDPGARAQEISCATVIPILTCLEDKVGGGRVAEIIEPLGLPLAFLTKRTNWVSFEYYNRLLDTLVEATENERAPFNAAFSVKPRETFDFIRYAAYATIGAGSPKPAYTLSLRSRFYERWTKVTEFRILHSSASSMRISLTLKKGLTQTRNNCLAMQGILSSIPMGIGLPKAEIEEVACAARGAPSCEYTLKWHNRSNLVYLIGLPLLGAALGVEILAFPGSRVPHDLALTVLAFTTLIFLVRSFQLWKSLRLGEYVSQERNDHILATMKMMEKDYAQMLDRKVHMEERSRYLSVVNGITAISAHSSVPGELLLETLTLLRDKLGFLRGDFFRLDPGRGVYVSLSKADLIFPKTALAFMAGKDRIPRARQIAASEFPPIPSWDQSENAGVHYVMPVIAPEVCEGFYLFAPGSSSPFSPLLIDALFENIARQLKTTLQRIASTSVIDAILSSIPASVLIFDQADMRVRYANRQFIESRTDDALIVGAPLFSILPFDADAQGAIRSRVAAIGTDDRSRMFETTLGQGIFECSIFAIPRQGETERLAGIIMSDISEAKYFQKNLLINQKLAALGRVASGIAHEINNPLYAVLSNAEEIAEDEGSSEEGRELAAEIVEHVMSVSHVVKNLSNYSKTLRKEEKSDVDLNAVIEESIVLVSYSSNIMEVVVTKELSPLPRIRAAKGEMQQVFINLFNNAIHAMDGRGSLSISSRCDGGRILISIADTGKGIAEKDMPYIYDLFFTTKTPGEGTGQGLYIVKKILTMNGGSIRAESREGEGAVFHVEFPMEVMQDGG
jgi:signal transduction histidine kinase